MKKAIIFVLFWVSTIIFSTCKKVIEVPKPKGVHPSFDARNRLSTQVNGQIDTTFEVLSWKNTYFKRIYDTIPFPRYYDCKNVTELFVVQISKEVTPSLINQLVFGDFFPIINVKQKYKYFLTPSPIVAPEIACGYDTTYFSNHYSILELDQAGSDYSVNEKELNYLMITSYDTLSGKMTGEFNLTFDKVYRNIREKYYESLPQKLEYRNGKFTVYVKKK